MSVIALYILTILSAVLLFGFMGLGIKKYGLLSCYSAYGPLWGKDFPKLNIWSVVTFITAFLMVPVMLEVSVFSAWQFLGFLAPTSLFLVSISPDYQTNKFSNVLHQIGAWSAVVAVISFVCIIPHLWWLMIPFFLAAGIMSFVFKDSIMLWGEDAVYMLTYAAMLMMI